MDTHRNAPRRILIIRLSAIGDVVMACGMIAALRRAYPEAELYWLAQSGPASLIAAHPDLAGVIVWPLADWRTLWRKRRWRELIRAARLFTTELRAYRFDWALDAHGLLKSGVWAWLCGARYRVGLGSREGSRWLMNRVVARPPDDRAFGSEYIELMRAHNIDANTFVPHIAVSSDDREHAKNALATARAGERYIVFAPFTTRAQKHWFEEHWIDLADRLAATHGLPIVVLGGPADRKAAERLARRSRGTVQSVAGQTALRESAAIISKAALIVGVDTGLTHMGTATHRPTIALFGATRPYSEPGVPGTRVLFEFMPCAPCRFSPTCDGRYTCMRRLTPTRVAETADALLAGTGA